MEKYDKGGVIINITSVHREIPGVGIADCAAAKVGLRNLTTTLALELSKERISVNNIAPEMVLTPINRQWMLQMPGSIKYSPFQSNGRLNY